MNVKELKVGDTVWAKMKGFCPWPALVCVPHGNMSQKSKKPQHLVFFLGTHDFAKVLDKDIFLNTKERLQSSILSPKKSSSWSLAIAEIQNGQVQAKFRTSIAWKLRQEEHCKKAMKIEQGSIKKAKKMNRKIQNEMKKIGMKEIEPKEIKMRGIEPRGIEPRGIEPRGIEPRGIEPKDIEPKDIEPKDIEPKDIEPKDIEPKDIEPKDIEPKDIEPKDIEPKTTEPKKTEPKKTEPKKTEPKKTQPKKTEPKKIETKKIEMKKMNGKIQKKHNNNTKICLKKQASPSIKTTSVLEHKEIVTNRSQPVMKKWCLSLYALMKKMIKPIGRASLEYLPTDLYSKVTQLHMSMNAMQQQFSFNSLPSKGKQLFLKCLAKLRAQIRREQMLEPALNIDSVSD